MDGYRFATENTQYDFFCYSRHLGEWLLLLVLLLVKAAGIALHIRSSDLDLGSHFNSKHSWKLAEHAFVTLLIF